MYMLLLHILLFILYFSVLSYSLLKIPFFRSSGIRSRALLLLFSLRVLTGCLHNWIAYTYYPYHGDIWSFYNNSFITRHELFTDFKLFVDDNSTWAYMSHNVISGLHVLFNFLSFDNLYINTLLFSFLVFWGNTALFRVFSGIFRNAPLCAICVFIIPSTLFWTSCIHTDGIIYLLLGLLLYYLQLRRFLPCLLLVCLIILFRSFILISLLPAMICWARASGERRWILPAFLSIIPIILITLIIWPGFSDSIMRLISDRQKEFQALSGSSRIYLPVLEPGAGNLLHLLPVAILNGLFEPLPGVGGQRIYMAFSLELVCIWVIIGLAIGYALMGQSRYPRSAPAVSEGIPVFPQDYAISGHPQRIMLFSLGCILFALTGMLMTGYIVPFTGAIVRYRSIYWPFLLAPFLYLLRGLPFFKMANRWLFNSFIKPLDNY